MSHEGVRIILVRPEEPGNVGAAARAMKNFGLRHLVLVDPRLRRPEKAFTFAHGAEEILEGADLESELSAAVAPVHRAFATTRRRGKHRGRVLLARDAALATAAVGGSVAWVFGPESAGLTSREVGLCSDRVFIPTAPAHPSLNLAQAVAVCSYELRLARMALPRTQAPGAASLAEREALYAHLERALLAVGFLHPGSAAARMAHLRRLLERAQPGPEEVRFLRGVARKVERAAASEPEARPGASRDQAARRSVGRKASSS